MAEGVSERDVDSLRLPRLLSARLPRGDTRSAGGEEGGPRAHRGAALLLPRRVHHLPLFRLPRGQDREQGHSFPLGTSGHWTHNIREQVSVNKENWMQGKLFELGF